MSKTGKKWKDYQATKLTKIPTTKRRKYGMNKTLTTNLITGDTVQSIIDIAAGDPPGTHCNEFMSKRPNQWYFLITIP